MSNAMTAKLSDAILDVLEERQRQIDVKGWTPEHDDEHADGSLARAAACYAVGDTSVIWWPRGWKFKRGSVRKMLVKAAALLIAEIERLDRLAERTAKAPVESGAPQ